MLDDLQQVAAHLEESLRVIEENGEDEILGHPEFLEAINEVAQSLIQVTRSLRELEQLPVINDEKKVLLDRKT